MNGKQINRATGLLVIEVRNSNPNGDPDNDSDPRIRVDDRGEISPVSFKAKLRHLVREKDAPVWQSLGSNVGDGLNGDEYSILESRGRSRDQIVQEIKDKVFSRKYWDARVFGNTFLEEDVDTEIRTGVVQFGLGLSLAPISIERLTTTNFAGVEGDKTRGMAPLGYRIVQHGVYCMPFFVNPTAAAKTGCTSTDIELLLRLIPFAYSHTASYVRSCVEVRHAWYVEHRSQIGSASDFQLIEALTPRKKADADKASQSWEDYDVPTKLPDALAGRVLPLRDLVQEAYDLVGA